MPIFSGENPDGWLYRAERYFEVNGLIEREKLGAIAVSLDGDVLSWLQWTEAKTSIQSWQQFQEQLLLRFRSTQEGNLCKKFLAMKQRETVAEFKREFEMLAAPLREISNVVSESTFVYRLRPEIRVEVRLLGPKGLGPIMEVAQKIEDRNMILRNIQGSMSHKTIRPVSASNRPDVKRFKGFSTRTVTVGEKSGASARFPCEEIVRR